MKLNTPTLSSGTIIHQRYRVVQLIGEGGSGAVYEARDLRLDSPVALKQLLLRGEQLSHQFEREARILANLSHPVLPNVIDHFTDAAGQFLVMQFIPGDDLGVMLQKRQAPFPVDDVFGWAEQLLDALDYLHSLEPPVIHRDIKPQNMKLRPRSGIVLLDFGLAKGLLNDGSSSTVSRSVAGFTPQFAPPEQLIGSGTNAQSDLFALGATLYYLLTNERPPDALRRLTATMEQRADPLRPAHELNPLVPATVSSLLAQALSLNASQRPASAASMLAALRQARASGTPSANDVDRTLIDRSLSRAAGDAVTEYDPDTRPPAAPVTSRNRGGRYRLPMSVLIGLVLTVLLVIAAGVGLRFIGRAQIATTATPAFGDTAQAGVASTSAALPSPTIDRQATIAPTPSVTDAPKPTTAPTAVATAIEILRPPTVTLLRTLSGGGEWLPDVKFSPDGRMVAVASFGKVVQLWQVSDGTLLHTFEGHTDWVWSVAFSPDGNTIASASEDGIINLWSVGDGVLLHTLTGHTGTVGSIAFSPDGAVLASASKDQTIKIWRVADGSLLHTFVGHAGFVRSIAFSPDGQLLASASDDNTVKLWRASDGTPLRTLEGHTDHVYAVAFSPDGQLLASGSVDTTVKLWRVSDGMLLHTLEGHASTVNSVAFASNGQLLASASYDKTIKLWRVSDGAQLTSLNKHTGVVYSIAFAPDGKLLASASQDQTVNLWQIQP